MGLPTEAVVIQIIITAGVILAAGIPAYLQFKAKLLDIGDDAAEARKQTQNSDQTNLREELDARHELIIGTLAELTRDLRGIRRDNLDTRKDIGQLRSDDRQARRDAYQLRQDLREHIRDTEPLLPAIKLLIEQHAPEHRLDRYDHTDEDEGPDHPGRGGAKEIEE